MRYEFIKAHERKFSVQQMCRVLAVGRSGYYAWRSRPASVRKQANQGLVTQIREEYQNSRQTYGSPRIHAALRHRGIACGRQGRKIDATTRHDCPPST